MTAPRIVIRAELRVHGREVETIVRPRWTDDQLAAASALEGREVTVTIEPADAPEVESPHGSALDYLAQIGRLLCDADPNDDSATLRRVARLANSAELALLNAQRGKP